MHILSFFTDDSLPKTGLTPTIKIRDVSDGSILINGASMTEVGDGFYRYDYTTYDSEKDYAIICDGGISLSDVDRYVYAGNENYIDDISSGVWNENIASITTSGTAGNAQMRVVYNGVVHIDTSNGTSGNTIYPAGIEGNPVNNISDALTIANSFGFKNFKIKGMLVLSSGDLSEYNFIGASNVSNNIIVLAGATVINSKFEEITLTGQVVGSNIYCFKCMISNLSNVDGIFLDSAFVDTITIAPGGEILGKAMSFASEPTIIDFNNNPGNFAVGAETGQIRIVNASDPATIVRYAAYGGTIQLDSTCVSGTAAFIGSGQIADNSGPGFIVDHTGLIAIPTIARAVWGVDLAEYDEPEAAGTALMNIDYGDKVNIDTISGTAGVLYPHGTSKYPVNNLTDALTIARGRNIDNLILESDLTVETGHDISGMSVETIGIMGTTLTFTEGCSADSSVFRQLSIEGTINSGDAVLIESCSIYDLENFTGLMNVVAFGQGAEVSFDTWATIIQGTAGGDPTNEPEFDIGTASVNVSQWTGNLKLKGKTGTNRTVVNCSSGNIIIDSTCVSGTIQLLGIGQVEKDESGPNCNVDTDAFISKDTIASATWDEPLVNHLLSSSTGMSLSILQFNNAVTVDVVNGVSGTLFDVGTEVNPVNNLTDALTIAETRGINTIKIKEDLTIYPADVFSKYVFIGDSPITTTVTVSSGSNVTQSIFKNCKMEGTLSGGNIIRDCRIGFLSYVNGYIFNCAIEETITLGGGINATIVDCYRGQRFPVGDPPTIDMGGSGQQLGLRRYGGGILIKNQTDSNGHCSIDLTSGKVVLDSTVTAGEVIIRGVGMFFDNSPGTAIIDATGLVNKDRVASAVWDEQLVDHINDETTGHALMHEAYDDTIFVDPTNGTNGSIYPHGIRQHPVKNITDILAVSNSYNLSKVHVLGSLVINGGEDISELTFTSDRSIGNSVIIANAITNNTYFDNLTVSGTMDGVVRYTFCVLGTITGFNGGAKESLLTNSITLIGSGNNYLTNVDTYLSIEDTYRHIIVGDCKLNMIRCEGNYEIDGKTGSDHTRINMLGGHIKVNSNCVSGSIHLEGIGICYDNSAAGCDVQTEHLVSPEEITDQVWDEDLSSHSTSGSTGLSIQKTLGLLDENAHLDQQVYNVNDRLLSARKRTYSNPASVGTDSDVIATYNITSTWSGNQLTSYKMVKV